jgi:FHS family L-fucose permease-like MFS transporter
MNASVPAIPASPQEHVEAPELRLFVLALFFTFGGITSLNDIIIPKLKELFRLNYREAMMVQAALFTAYLIVAVPAATLVKRPGYMRGAVVGLLTMMSGCLLFAPASQSATFGVFLFALFPYAGSILILGGLGHVSIGDLSGAALDAYRVKETEVVIRTYLGLAAALALVAGVVWLNRNRLKAERHEGGALSGLGLLSLPRFAFGTLGIFLYVGAEVAIGSLIVNYMMQERVLGLDEASAGKLIAFYWGGALLGRFVGSAVLRAFSPGKVLAINAAGAIALLLVSANRCGALAACSLLAIGLMNSIMFPTIFSLACEGLGSRAADGSGVVCVAIVGGAVIPPLTGHVADISGSLGFALLVPALCYAVIAAFGVYARRPVEE